MCCMKQRLSIFLVIFCIMTLLSGIMVVNAETYTVPCKQCGSHTFENSFEKEVYMLRYDFEWNCIFSEYDDDDGLSLEEILEFDIKNEFANLWSIVGKVYEVLKPVGLVLASILILCEMMNYATAGNATADNLLLYFIKMAGAMLVILNGYEILTLIFEFCTIAYNSVAPSFDDFSNKTAYCFYDSCHDVFWVQSIMDYLTYFIMSLPLFISRIIIKVICWTRIFMILGYAAFTPIGIADMMNGGMNSSGVRYLKTLTAKILQGAVIAGSYVAYKLIIEAVSQNASWFSQAGVTILLSVMIVAFIMMSERITEEIVG